MENLEVVHNKEKHRYEIAIEGKIAIADYIINNEGVVYMTHTEVPKELGGRGIASQLIANALQDIKNQGKKIVPLCTFVKVYIEKNPEWESLL